MKKILTIFLSLLLIVRVQAFDNSYFTVNIPDGYLQDNLNSKTEFRWTNDKKYILITINDNSKLKYDIKEYTKEDIENQKKYLETKMNEGLSKYKINVEVKSINKVSNENENYLEYDLFYPSKSITGYDMYQKGRMYTTNSYITTILYSSDKEINQESEFTNIINSFIIKDKKVINIDIKNYIIFIIITGIVLGIIGYIIKLKKRN